MGALYRQNCFFGAKKAPKRLPSEIEENEIRRYLKALRDCGDIHETSFVVAAHACNPPPFCYLMEFLYISDATHYWRFHCRHQFVRRIILSLFLALGTCGRTLLD